MTDAAGQTVADDADSRQRLRPVGTSMTLAPSAHRPYALGMSAHAITPSSPALVTIRVLAHGGRGPHAGDRAQLGEERVGHRRCSPRRRRCVTVPASVEPTGAGPRLATIVVITPTATLVTKSASMMPLIARKPAFGLSARRRAAMSVAGRLAYRAMTRAPTIVNHGPAKTRPAMMSSRPGRNTAVWPSDVWGRKPMAKNSTATPSTIGISRYARGARGVTRRVTPSGEIRTRRSETWAATAAPAGTPSATSRASSTPSDMSLGKNGMPVNGMPASGSRKA